MAEVNEIAKDMLLKIFSEDVVAAIVDYAEDDSTLLADILNEYADPEAGRKIEISSEPGIYMDENLKVMTICSDMIPVLEEDYDIFALRLTHEMGHVAGFDFIPGGIDLGVARSSMQQQEARAVLQEYFVAKDKGLDYMASDSTGQVGLKWYIELLLDNLNITGTPHTVEEFNNMFPIGCDALHILGQFIGQNMSPKNAPYLSYDEYFDIQQIIKEAGLGFKDVYWPTVKPENVILLTNEDMTAWFVAIETEIFGGEGKATIWASRSEDGTLRGTVSCELSGSYIGSYLFGADDTNSNFSVGMEALIGGALCKLILQAPNHVVSDLPLAENWDAFRLVGITPPPGLELADEAGLVSLLNAKGFIFPNILSLMEGGSASELAAFNAILNTYSTASPANQGGPTTDYVGVTITSTSQATQSGAEGENEATGYVLNQYLRCDGATDICITMPEGMPEIDVNTATGLGQLLCYITANGIMPADNNVGQLSSLVVCAQSDISSGAYTITETAQWNTATQNAQHDAPIDPLVLDLNGDGVVLTDFATNPVLFDADHDGAYEQAGWASAQDGILVKDLNDNQSIDDIGETLSEYFNGTEGEGGSPGTKPFAHGFAALVSLDSDHNGVFNSADADWNNVQVWIDANHDGMSFDDVDGDREKDEGEATELVSLSSLSITAINLTYSTQSGLVRDGNEVLASGTFTMNGETEEALAANFLYNPNGHSFTQQNTIITTQGDTPEDVVTAYSSNSTEGETIDVAVKGVRNAYGNIGDDTLIGDANNNVLAGGPGSDTFDAGAGDDVLCQSAFMCIPSLSPRRTPRRTTQYACVGSSSPPRSPSESELASPILARDDLIDGGAGDDYQGDTFTVIAKYRDTNLAFPSLIPDAWWIGKSGSITAAGRRVEHE